MKSKHKILILIVFLVIGFNKFLNQEISTITKDVSQNKKKTQVKVNTIKLKTENKDVLVVKSVSKFFQLEKNNSIINVSMPKFPDLSGQLELISDTIQVSVDFINGVGYTSVKDEYVDDIYFIVSKIDETKISVKYSIRYKNGQSIVPQNAEIVLSEYTNDADIYKRIEEQEAFYEDIRQQQNREDESSFTQNVGLTSQEEYHLEEQDIAFQEQAQYQAEQEYIELQGTERENVFTEIAHQESPYSPNPAEMYNFSFAPDQENQ